LVWVQGASKARLPVFFYVFDRRSGAPSDVTSHHQVKPLQGAAVVRKKRSIAICSVHFAAGPKSETRDLQFANMSSLMPGASHDPTSCLFALMGDLNSESSVSSKVDFTVSDIAVNMMQKLNGTVVPGEEKWVLTLQKDEKTSVVGKRYDEVIAHKKACNDRCAHVYPRRDVIFEHRFAALPEEEQMEVLRKEKSLTKQFEDIFTDHLPVYMDLAFGDDEATSSSHVPSTESKNGTARRKSSKKMQGQREV